MTTTSLLSVTLRPRRRLIYNKRKEGWKLLEVGPKVEGEPCLKLASFFLKGEWSVKGPMMRSRALEMGGRTGQHHAERLLQQAETIPNEWRHFQLVFPGTLWRDPDGHLWVPYLRWGRGGGWMLYFDPVDCGIWFDNCRVVCICK